MPTELKIAQLNDEYRRYGKGNGRTMVTSSVANLGFDFQLEALRRVAAFDEFTDDNDPHKEHDFGSFELRGQTIFWKIDYYDLQLEHGAEDPSDPSLTCRVLTIMLAEDY